MMSNKGNYLAAADHELECDILQVGGKAFYEDLIVTRQSSMHTFAAPLHGKHQHAHRLAEEDHWHEDTGTGDLPHCCQQVAQKHDKQVSSIVFRQEF